MFLFWSHIRESRAQGTQTTPGATVIRALKITVVRQVQCNSASPCFVLALNTASTARVLVLEFEIGSRNTVSTVSKNHTCSFQFSKRKKYREIESKRGETLSLVTVLNP